MYPVTLEHQNGEQWTVQPPCYGFMKKGTADMYPYTFYPSICQTDIGGIQMNPHTAVPFNQLKFIWNSGTHVCNSGFSESENFDRDRVQSRENPRYIPRQQNTADFRWRGGTGAKDFIREAMVKLNLTIENNEDGQPWDYIDEVKAIEACFDCDSDSIIRRYPMAYGLFGVQVDDNIPADRALNYLMIARMFTTHAGRSRAYMYGRYVKGLTPSQAIIFAAVLSIDVDWQGNPAYSWIACSNDSCIYPSYMIAAGIGALYATPQQVVWKQPCYCDMNGARGTVGHLREDNSPRLRVRCHRTGVVKETIGAMFMAIFSRREVASNWKAATLEVLDSLSPASGEAVRRGGGDDIGTSTYNHNSNSVIHYYEHIKQACVAQNTNVADEVIRVLNTPLAQPAAR